MIHRAFKAVMSRGDDIPLDPDELALIQNGATTGRFIKVRQGIINPSYLISIVEDKERRKTFLEETKYPQDKERRTKGMEPLLDIFANRPQLPAAKSQ
jgi:hypothetical protein